ncbi:MAG: aldo/keto reductase [Lentisphaerae bacterium]|nr:aldo/keto reductase [Lentisphaerota bacterium]
MERRILGKTGLSVSPICIGAWQLGGPLAFDGQPDGHPDPGREVVLRMIRELGDLGVNFIDTAEQYSDGESERRVGAAIAGHRAEWIVSTKFGYRVGLDGARDDSAHSTRIQSSLEGSLKRLKTDYVDVYLYHCRPELDDLEAGRVVLERMVQQGKCRFYGISTNHLGLIEAMAEGDMLQVVQYSSSLLADASEIRAVAREHNIGTQVRGVMAQGRLSGKYFDHTPTWRPDDNRSRAPEADFQKYAVLADVLPDGITMAQAAIRWVLDQPESHSICMGAKTLADYRSALAAATMPPLNAEVRTALASRVAAL